MGLAIRPGSANLTVLESTSLSDNNSLEEPARVVPKESRLENPGVESAHEFPPRSLSILRWETR
jgi:alpha-L-arabinofuranosidase